MWWLRWQEVGGCECGEEDREESSSMHGDDDNVYVCRFARLKWDSFYWYGRVKDRKDSLVRGWNK